MYRGNGFTVGVRSGGSSEMISTDRFRVGDLVGAVSDCHGIQLDVVHNNGWTNSLL